jgi:DUF4097 and DUF4098 domain-containing protein YvlB
MKKVLITISIIFLIAAALIFLSTLSAHEWSFKKLMNPALTKTHEINDSFEDISISVDTADVKLVPTDEKSVRVECRETYKLTNTVEVKDGVLKIEGKDSRRWYELATIIPVHFEITVYLPKGEWGELRINTATGDSYVPAGFSFKSVDIKKSTGNISIASGASGNMNLKTSTGDIDVSNVSSENLSVNATTGDISLSSITSGSLYANTSTGDIALSDTRIGGNILINSSTGKQSFTNVSCKSFSSSADTGDALLTSVIAEGALRIERSTGNVKLESSDAAEIHIETDTGNVTGTLLSDKVFIVRTDTGDIDVPKSTVGGRCEIETDTGNIIISVK